MENTLVQRKQEILEIFQLYMDERNQQYISKNLVQAIQRVTEDTTALDLARWQRVTDDLKDKRIEIIQSDSEISILKIEQKLPFVCVYYRVLITWKVKHFQQLFESAWVESRVCLLQEEQSWKIVSDRVIEKEGVGDIQVNHPFSVDVNYEVRNPNERRARYNRAKAVQYAETWWNDYNPKFKKFEVDCTNFISQCLWAGGAPMKHSSDRAKGWWYRFEQPANWSFSWSVANALRWYLPNSRSGLRGREVSSADQLQPGDVICYDFDGDGHWQHNTIVVAKDGVGMPLVNAHTTNSRNRFWDYRDSYAWTEKTAYKFFQIADDF